MRQASAVGTPVHTAVLRSRRQSMVIRTLERAPGAGGTLLAAGEMARPGLAYRQIERAVAALGAR
jgi:hypothetical protein